MLIATLPDVHLMDRTPKNRKDKMRETCLNKFETCLEIAWEYKIEALMVPGDLFDTALGVPSYEFTGEVIKICLRHPHLRIIAIPGQHDLRYHTKGISNTPIGLLAAAGCIEIPTIFDPVDLGHGPLIYGCGWGDEQKMAELIENGWDVSRDVLLIHKMITKDKPLFPGQYDYMTAANFLKKYPFRVVLSGDNHQRHIMETKTQALINGGSMMRLRKDQIDYQPRIHFIDTESLDIQYEDIPIEKDVFDFSKMKEEEEKEGRKEKVDELIKAIKMDKEKVKFGSVLHHLTAKMKPEKAVVDLLDNIMDEAKLHDDKKKGRVQNG